jgi:hypothetical protein
LIERLEIHAGSGREDAGGTQALVGGLGRKPGSKNILSGQNKRDIKEFFQTLTIDSMRWRTNVKKQLESADDGTQLRHWSDLALRYGFGVPAKMQVEGAKQKSLYFVTTTGLYPWQMDNMKEQTDRMIQQGKAEDELRALEAKKPETIEADKADRDSEVPEDLEVVQEPPQDFTGGRR